MDLEKYKNDGWGLSKKQLTELLEIIKNHEKPKLRILEFGSGKSTEFLCDLVKLDIKNLEITSFDDNEFYAYKGIHPFLDLKIRKLVECGDYQYSEMFKKKEIINEFFKDKQTPLSSRQKNNFYNIKSDDLFGIYDLMILDGPNGNGRNISYLHVKKHLDIDSIILIDDYTHYDFMEKLSLFFEYEILYQNTINKSKVWNNGGDYSIIKINKVLK